MATTTKKTTKKPTKAVQPKSVKSPAKKRETMADLKKKIAELEVQRDKALENYGKMLEVSTNMSLKINVMLGQMLKALFIIGIGPDELHAKCEQMFRKKVVAD